MKDILYLIIFLSFLSSCGLLGISHRDIEYLSDEDKKEFFNKLNNSEYAIKKDSIKSRLEQAKEYFPNDLKDNILYYRKWSLDEIKEFPPTRFDLNKGDERYLKMLENQDKFLKKLGKKYHYQLQIISGSDSAINDAKYFLKYAAILFPYNEDELSVTKTGSVAGWAARGYFFIYDIQEDKYYKALPDIKLLYKH